MEEGFMDAATQLAHSQEVAGKIAYVLQKRVQGATERYGKRLREASDGDAGRGQILDPIAAQLNPWNTWHYVVDVAQRSVLFWDTLRERGTEFVERTSQGLKPVLHFDYDVVLDARLFARPVNYALLCIKAPEGVTVDANKRPYLIIDPRAGHGPGIGGFKDDSQVGVALHAGHPVYFVVFFQNPVPGQTLLDVCAAEQEFIRKVRALHPDSPKPAIVGNCQGGWAAMMLASSDPDDTGPIVINGAPMSYWSGAWSEGEGDNPMRYSGGILGGTWLASFSADLGNGKFDGAYLVQNFEYLNPANTFWDKYYHLFEYVDTEPPRFLEFERWWGGYYLMNREEIEWITRNLFIGNKLWSGEVRGAAGKSFDLRDIRAPIVLFASMGDNITPPQQAFNWVADLYGSTEEIKARGQVIVGLMHQDAGHLGIFVSGKVAKKEHAQIVNVLETIETLAPGLYGMSIEEAKGANGKVAYEVSFVEHRLEDIVQHFNRFKREDEKPFEAVVELSEFTQRAYELFAQPYVQSTSNEITAHILREFHPMRFQRWAFSDLNPWLAWLPTTANAVKANRQHAGDIEPWRKIEQRGAEIISASLDYYRAIRDAGTESLFFTLYTNPFLLHFADRHRDREAAASIVTDPRELPFVKEALASIGQGGYTEAVARAAFLLGRRGDPLPLTRLATQQEMIGEYAEYLPSLPPDQWRRIRGEQELIATYEPEQAIATLPLLLAKPKDRKRLLTLLERLLADERVQSVTPTAQQLEALQRICAVLGAPPAAATVAALPHAPS
jgi:pimeloyl-ACP methyl ester carboxylesterase